MAKERAETLIPYIKNKQAVSNLPITMGVSPTPGDQPIIEMIAFSPNSTLQATAKKIVQSQSARTLVFAGETFGKISHRIKPTRGFNVFGEPLRAKPNYPDILIGSGVLVQANDSLVAAVDGYLYSNEKDLWISPVSIINSTKIDQRKPIKVHGDTIIIGDLDQNVDIVGTGSIVATGTIICKKMIINGNLFVNGGLRCSEETDRVVVRGDLTANYIVSGVHFISKNLRSDQGSHGSNPSYWREIGFSNSRQSYFWVYHILPGRNKMLPSGKKCRRTYRSSLGQSFQDNR